MNPIGGAFSAIITLAFIASCLGVRMERTMWISLSASYLAWICLSGGLDNLEAFTFVAFTGILMMLGVAGVTAFVSAVGLGIHALWRRVSGRAPRDESGARDVAAKR
jgi:hypothetical protein